MDRFEYRWEVVTAAKGEPPDADGLLDRLGADGWEAVGVAPSTASGHGLRVETTAYVVLLKRRVVTRRTR